MYKRQLFAAWPKTSVSPAEIARLAKATLDQLVRTQDFSGCVTVTDGTRTIVDECRGLAERRFNIPVNQQTKFHIASMNKMFTAVAVAQLVEAGKLAWDDTLALRVPEYPDQAAAKHITVWQLLHHTSGSVSYTHLDVYKRQPSRTAPMPVRMSCANSASGNSPA